MEGALVCCGTDGAWRTVATRAFGQLNHDAPHVIKSLVFPEQRYSDDVCKGGINVENVYLRFLQFFVNKMRNLIKFILFVCPYRKKLARLFEEKTQSKDDFVTQIRLEKKRNQ